MARPQRRPTKTVNIGGVLVGGDAPVVVQSMTTAPTSDAEKTLRQIKKLARAGCEIIRVAVPDLESAKSLAAIVSKSPLPVVADIHFDPNLALASIDSGVHGLRLNPGNIRNKKALKEVVRAASSASIPIRVGVNAGSIARDVREKHGGDVPAAMVESAMSHVELLEELGFEAIKISLKASDVMTTVESYRRMSGVRDYPLHLGVTEAGTAFSGLIKSAAGIGMLLAEGIGDTIRVSLAADPAEEIRAAYGILASVGVRERGVEVIACPTCARAGMDVFKTASAVEKKLAQVPERLRVAVMGCGVNGPGEARHADVGAVGTPKGIQLYLRGKRAGEIGRDKVVSWIVENVKAMALESRQNKSSSDG